MAMRRTLVGQADERPATYHVYLAAKDAAKRPERRTDRRLIAATPCQAAEPDEPVVLHGPRWDLLVLQHGRAHGGRV